MKITYRYVEDTDKKYMISNYGDVISLKRNKPRILKQNLNGRGYKAVGLYKNGKIKCINVHVLVGNAFVGKRIDSLSFDHIDRVRTNNRADNIRLATKSEQQINQNMMKNNTTGERNINIKRKGNYAGYRIQIKRNGKVVIDKWLNMKKYTMDDAIKFRDEQLAIVKV